MTIYSYCNLKLQSHADALSAKVRGEFRLACSFKHVKKVQCICHTCIECDLAELYTCAIVYYTECNWCLICQLRIDVLHDEELYIMFHCILTSGITSFIYKYKKHSQKM